EVDAGQDADGRGDERRGPDDQQDAIQRVLEPALRARLRRALCEQRRPQRFEAVHEQHGENPEQEQHPDRHRRDGHREVEAVDEQPLAIARKDLHVRAPSPRASRAIRRRDAARTISVSTNSTRPSVISAPRWIGSAASLHSFASAEAMELPGSNSDARIRYALPITNVTAIVSPSARPRPSM